MTPPRVIGWVSGGAASAVACKLAIAKYGPDRVVLAYKDTGSEDIDTVRFLADLEAWFSKPIMRLTSEKYADTWEVWEKNRYLRSPFGGAKCTTELKVRVGRAFQRPDDIQVWGFTAEEAKRASLFRRHHQGEMTVDYPLIENSITKADCFAIITRAGLVLPRPYLLGFHNNNCIPCVKAQGAAYWNRIRRHYPAVFWRMAALERELDFPLVRIWEPISKAKVSVFLDELDPLAGIDDDEPEPISCGITCFIAEQNLEPAS